MKRREFLTKSTSVILLTAASGGIFKTIAAAAKNDPRDEWGTVPLGPDVPARQWGVAPNIRPLQTRLKVLLATGEPLELAAKGRIQTAIVLATKPSRAARAGASILQQALYKMVGDEPPIISEAELKVGDSLQVTSQGKEAPFVIIVGDSKAGQQLGITADDLPPEGYRIKTHKNALFVIGNDGTSGNQLMGTRHGVYALLERHFGCCWLWSGELGEIIPQSPSITLNPIDETDAPAIVQRVIRNYYRLRDGKVFERASQGIANIGYTDEEIIAKVADSGTWLDAQRTGRSVGLQYQHAYAGWWDKYGAEHPDWFALQPDGSRKAHPPRERLETTNDGVIAAAAAQTIARLKADPNLQAASISPNDGSNTNKQCMCEVCRKLDPPNAPKVTLSFNVNGENISVSYPSLSDRYVTYYSRVAEIVAKEMPDRWVGAYAYSNYRTPPLYAKLPDNVLLGFVGLGYFDDSQLQRDRDSWNGWAQSASKLLLRPNLLYSGHGMLAIYAHKLADDIKHAYSTGMMAADFDSLIHHWATQGLNYYVLAKLLWDPSLDVDELIKDYCDKGFGAASEHVQKYFSEAEKLTSQLAAGMPDSEEGELRDEEVVEDVQNIRSQSGIQSYRKFWMTIPYYYTPQKLAEFKDLLSKARASTTDKSVQQRLDFLEAGLRYTEVQAKAMTAIYVSQESDEKVKNKRIVETLNARQSIYEDIFENYFYAVDLAYVNWRESSWWKRHGWNWPNRISKDK